MGEGWRFRLIGPLEVRHDGVEVPIAAPKQRVLIAVLALAAGEPVAAGRLIACLWGDNPPRSARNTLQNYVLRLRRTLTVDAEPGPLVNSVAGYRLDVDADAVDVRRFRSLVRSARSTSAAGKSESAAAQLDEALRLWHGEPLADVSSELLHREVVPGLVEQRLAAVELRIDLDLGVGRHGELIPELIELTTEHPLRERLWAQLMLALHRSGRTAEALDAYRQAGKLLAEELGIDPGPELYTLYQAVLTNDPTLTADGGGTDSAPELARQHTRPMLVVPRQLPPPTTHFVGRAAEVRRLDAQRDAASEARLMVIFAISGTAGVGKTALALHWGHRHAEEFPDGQLYVNLRGFDPTGDPLPAMTAMHRFLTALGVPAQSIPTDPDEQVAFYRSQLAGRRILLLLDNARDAEQVRPLLPGTPGCLVLVTSRHQLAGLVAVDGAVPLTLDLLSQDEGHDLLIRRLGRDRIMRERATVDELIELCARLPLAINIVAAQAALYPNRPFAAFVDELRDTHRRLDALTIGDATADVRAVFSWSCQSSLTPTSRRLFRLLGLYPGADIDLFATASLADHDLDTTRRAMDDLARAHLINEYAPGRYTMHDLLRAYAAEIGRRMDSDAEREAALLRVIDFYTRTAVAAELVLSPHREPLTLDPVRGVQPYPISDLPDALAWLDAEYHNVLAAQQVALARGWHRLVWQLAWSLITHQARKGHRHDHVVVWQAALDAAIVLADGTSCVFAHRRLGAAIADLGRHDEGIDHLHKALARAEEHDDLEQQAETHRMLAWIWERHGDNRKALEHATRTLDLRQAIGQPTREAEARNQVGWYLAQLGEYAAARTYCEEALAMQRRTGDPLHAATTLDSLGYIAYHSGRHRQAIDYYQQALPLLAELGHVVHTADTLEVIGHPYAALGEYEQARTVWRQALELYRQQGRDESADRVQRRLDELDRPHD